MTLEQLTHVEGIHIAIAFIVDDNGGCCTISPAVTVGSYAFDPVRIGGDIILGSEVNIATKLIQTVEVEWAGRRHGFKVHFGCDM